MFVCLLNDLILGFCYTNLTWETGGFELASTVTLALQKSRLIKCSSHPYYCLLISIFCATTWQYLCDDVYVKGVFLRNNPIDWNI